MKDQFYYMEGIMKIAFILSAILMPGLAGTICFFTCVLGFCRQTGLPQWNAEYAKRALENEFLQNIFYMVPFVFFPGAKNLLFYMPICIHFRVGIAEFINLKVPFLYSKLAKYVDFTRNNRRNLMH